MLVNSYGFNTTQRNNQTFKGIDYLAKDSIAQLKLTFESLCDSLVRNPYNRSSKVRLKDVVQELNERGIKAEIPQSLKYLYNK